MRGATDIMAKRIFSLLIAAVCTLLLSACSADNGYAKEICEHFRNIEREEYIVEITAIFPEHETEFTLNYIYNKDKNDRATLLAPSEIEGIAFEISENTSKVLFDGAILELGGLGSAEISPFSSVWRLISSWCSGNYSEADATKLAGRDSIMLISNISKPETELELRTWFSKDTFTPLYAEIFSDGERIIKCEFERAESSLNEYIEQNTGKH